MEKIRPIFNGIEIISETNEDDSWSKEIQVYLLNKNMTKRQWLRKHYEDIGEAVTLIVCSPAYVKKNSSDYSIDEQKKLKICNTYDQSKIENYVKGIIDTIGEVTINQLHDILIKRFFLDKTEWE